MKQHTCDIEAICLTEHSYFFVGAHYIEVNGKALTQGGMYVEKFVPQEQTQTTPIVMIHGGSQTATNFIGTPDGRRGWLHDFLLSGYTVYLVDQPERGRSGHSLERIHGEHLEIYNVERIEDYFSAPAKNRLWPQARHHTQWPGSGEKGDPVFDQFYASQVDGLWDKSEIERLNQKAVVDLLDKIGAAILLTHSQSGPFGWLVADVRPSGRLVYPSNATTCATIRHNPNPLKLRTTIGGKRASEICTAVAAVRSRIGGGLFTGAACKAVA